MGQWNPGLGIAELERTQRGTQTGHATGASTPQTDAGDSEAGRHGRGGDKKEREQNGSGDSSKDRSKHYSKRRRDPEGRQKEKHKYGADEQSRHDSMRRRPQLRTYDSSAIRDGTQNIQVRTLQEAIHAARPGDPHLYTRQGR